MEKTAKLDIPKYSKLSLTTHICTTQGILGNPVKLDSKYLVTSPHGPYLHVFLHRNCEGFSQIMKETGYSRIFEILLRDIRAFSCTIQEIFIDSGENCEVGYLRVS